MTVGMSHARAVGARFVACASTGNTSASLASYAAAAEIPALVLIPEGKISGGKLAQTIAHGAMVVQVEGDFDVALALLRQVAADYDRYQVYLVNSVNPFRLEGQKTIVFEMLEQLGWQIPDVIVLPGGNLGNTAAFGKALTELARDGLIDRMPRLADDPGSRRGAVRRLLRIGLGPLRAGRGRDDRHRDQDRQPGQHRASHAAHRSRPAAWSPRSRTTRSWTPRRVIDRIGIGCEPASAASLAGVRKLVASGEIKPGETVVGILTGHVLKDTDAVTAYHLGPDSEYRPMANRPISIPADSRCARESAEPACGLASAPQPHPQTSAPASTPWAWRSISGTRSRSRPAATVIRVSYVGSDATGMDGLENLLGAGNAPARRRARPRAAAVPPDSADRCPGRARTRQLGRGDRGRVDRRQITCSISVSATTRSSRRPRAWKDTATTSAPRCTVGRSSPSRHSGGP